MFRRTLLAFLGLGICALAQTTNPIVDLGYAIYQGSFNEASNTTNFLGMRFAAPPVGNLRFQAPQQPLNQRSLGVQQANKVSAGCLQAPFGMNTTAPFFPKNTQSSHQRRQFATGSEDCLFLNVYASGPLSSTAKMPVIVWIHGGGYVAGNTQGQSGDDLIKEAGGGIVAVTLDYRLGVFGFLPGSQVKAKGSLNNALLDQQAAMVWVQRNIHLFGGDPNQVTIWGESAGAGSVIQHMVAHGGNTQPPLFKAVISSSLFLGSQYRFDDSIPEQIYAAYVQSTGCSTAADTFQCLVNVDVQTLSNANVEINESAFSLLPVDLPVVDGEFIRGSPVAQFLSGKLNGERLLMVTNSFEGLIFVNPTLTARISVAQFVTQLFPTFNQTLVNAAAAQYNNVPGLVTTNDKAVGIFGESLFICPTYTLLQSFKGPAFRGEFAVPPGTHGSDVAYYFPNGAAPPFSNAQFDASFAGAFTGFAKFGDPNVHPVSQIITPKWNTFKPGNSEMLFNRTTSNQPDIRAFTTDPGLLSRCAFWKSLSGPMAQ